MALEPSHPFGDSEFVKVSPNQKLEIEVPAAPDRRPKVTELEPEARMVWSDGAAPMFRGVRTFTLTPSPDGGTVFAMNEELSGVMVPLVPGSLPDFGPIFETYARDLKREAERNS